MKIKRRIGFIAVLSAILLIFGLIFRFCIDEFIHKIKCVDKMVETYNDKSVVQSKFEQINKDIMNLAKENNTDHYEILISDEQEHSDEHTLHNNYSFILDEYSFLRNSIYDIVYDSNNVYYVFEESEYIFVYSDSDKPNVALINSKDNYLRYELDNNMNLFIKIQYYD